ncbi:MAG: efflux RND transporter permease subunit [Dysgonamonadaceae bacterium]|jgi:hydrophobe/amphiphile efflux-1 (HAE1) family protein|nr:efflux RND transporter permease subunit [Dysgonamonadaceae bacterium]
MKIVKLSIQRPSIVIVTFAALLFFGFFSYRNLNKELFPNMSYPLMTVSTAYPGGGPQEVESAVTKSIENALASLEGIKYISGISMESFSVVIVEFRMGTDIDKTLQEAQRKINAIRLTLPDGVKESSLAKISISDLPVLNIGATSNMPPSDFYDFIKNEVKPSIEQIPGVATVQLVGGNEREIQVNLDEERMKAYGLSILQVSRTLINSNLDFPTGKVKDDRQQVMIRLAGKYTSTEDIENVVLKVTAGGAMVRVKDIADVTDAQKETTTINRVDNRTSIGMLIQRQSDANTVEVCRQVENRLDRMKAAHLEKDKSLDFVIALNESEFTVEAADSVVHDLLLAALLVAAAMLLFLHSFRNSLIVLISIPASLVATFIVMYLLGFTLNLMTLLGLSLVVGILVDDAIVVIENIHRHLEMGKDKMQAAYDGLKEIGATVVSITLVLVVVFLPVTFTQSIVSELFRQFCITVAAATLLSLLASFTLVPWLSSRIGKIEHIHPNRWWGKIINGFERGMNRFAESMASLLRWSFRHKLIVFGVTVGLFIASLSLFAFGLIGEELMSIGDRGEFFIEIELPKNATIEQTNRAAYQAESIIRSSPVVKSVFTTVGTSDLGQPQANLADIFVKMVPYDQRDMTAPNFAREVKLSLQSAVVGAKIRTAVSGITGGKDDTPIELYVVGNQLDSLIATADKIRDNMSVLPGVVDAKSSVEGGNPEIHIAPDRLKMAALGVSFDMLGAALSNAFNGNRDAKFKKDNNEWDIHIRLADFDRKNIDDVKNFALQNLRGEMIRLDQFAEVSESEGATRLDRRNRLSSVTLNCQVAGRPIGTVGNEIKAMIAQMPLPEGVGIEYGGELAVQDDAFGTLGFALLVSILLVYLIMVVLYDNYVRPFVVLVSIPLALIGALFAMALSMQSLSLFTMLGLIMLVGLVAKNAIIVVDFAGQLQQEGMEVKEALIEATRKRFRPVVMTTLATIIGMLPIALAQGPGAEWKNGLAWALIGGLTSSMFLTLIVIPLVYYGFDRIKTKWGREKKQLIQ